MAAPTFTAEDIQGALQSLLPQGKVWPREPDSIQAKTLGALSPTFKRNCDSAAFVLVDAFPSTTEFLLPEWEATLGLPDPCGGEAQTLAQRIAQVVAKLTHPGGQSAEYFIELADALGYPGSTITTNAPFRCGRNRCGDPLGDAGWFFVWTFNAPVLPVSYFQCGVNRCGDPLYSIGGEELRCTIQRYAPAHTNVLFSGYA